MEIINNAIIIFIFFGSYIYLYTLTLLKPFMKEQHIRTLFNIWKIVEYVNYFGFHKKIEIKNYDKITTEKNKWGFIISNHKSILDSIIIMIIMKDNKLHFTNLKTISKYSKKNLQNEALKMYNMVLIKREWNDDIKYVNKMVYKWENENRNQQIVMFPEGSILTEKTATTYNNLRNIHCGLFNYIVNKIINVKYIYDLTIIYKVNNRILIGEKDIFYNFLTNPEFKIIINFDKYEKKNISEDWLEKIWKKKDDFIMNYAA